jgi:hypothetical protein
MEPNFKALFELGPFLQMVFDPSFRIVAVSDEHAKATLIKRDEVLGCHLFEVFPDNPDNSGADGVSSPRQSLLNVMKTRRTDTIDVQRYDVPIPESDQFEVRYWKIRDMPILGDAGMCCGF